MPARSTGRVKKVAPYDFQRHFRLHRIFVHLLALYIHVRIPIFVYLS